MTLSKRIEQEQRAKSLELKELLELQHRQLRPVRPQPVPKSSGSRARLNALAEATHPTVRGRRLPTVGTRAPSHRPRLSGTTTLHGRTRLSGDL